MSWFDVNCVVIWVRNFANTVASGHCVAEVAEKNKNRKCSEWLLALLFRAE